MIRTCFANWPAFSPSCGVHPPLQSVSWCLPISVQEQVAAILCIYLEFENQGSTCFFFNFCSQICRDPLELKGKRNRLAMMYMFNNGLAEIDKHKYLIPEFQVHTSRYLHNLAYKVASSSTIYHKFSFFPRTIKDWNSLPQSMVELPSLASSKARLANHF